MTLDCPRKKQPYLQTYKNIVNRCLNPKHRSFKFYGGRGIAAEISVNDLKILWFRDKAYLMKEPSIDRIDRNGHYTFANCRYIEMSENLRIRNQRTQKGDNHDGK